MQTFDPKIFSGPIEKFISWRLRLSCVDILRTSAKKYRNIVSLEKVLSVSDSGKDFALKSGLQARELSPEITVELLDALSSRLKLNLMEKAVLFGYAAGYSSPVIGPALGVVESRAVQIRISLRKKIGKLLSKQDIMDI